MGESEIPGEVGDDIRFLGVIIEVALVFILNWNELLLDSRGVSCEEKEKEKGVEEDRAGDAGGAVPLMMATGAAAGGCNKEDEGEDE